MKRFLICFMTFCLAVLLCFLFFYHIFTPSSVDCSYEVEDFPEKYEDFELIKDLVLSCGEQNTSFSLLREDDKPNSAIIGLHHFPVSMDQEQLDALNSLAELFTMSFNFIRIDENGVRFGGQGYQMFVYSFDGCRPKYFYHEGDSIQFDIADLGNQWYYLRTNFI